MNPDHQGVMLVFTTPSAGTTVEKFNTWYDETHIPELLEHIDGIVSVRRFRASGEQEPLRFLAVYELDRPAADVLESLRAPDSPISRSDVLDTEVHLPDVQTFEAIH